MWRNWSNVDLIEFILFFSDQFTTKKRTDYSFDLINVWCAVYKEKNRLDAYECEWFDSYEKDVSVNENKSTAMKLEIEMIIAETKSFAENIIIEMIAVDAASFVMKLTSKMIFAEAKSFVESIADKMTSADAVSFDEIMNFDSLDLFDEMMLAETRSFDEINFDSFSFWYEIWTEAFEVNKTVTSANWCCCTKATKTTKTTRTTNASKTWNVTNAIDSFDWFMNSISNDRWSKIYSKIRWWTQFNSCTEDCFENSIRFRLNAVWIFQRLIWRAYAISSRFQDKRSDFTTNATDVAETANCLIDCSTGRCCCTKGTNATETTDATQTTRATRTTETANCLTDCSIDRCCCAKTTGATKITNATNCLIDCFTERCCCTKATDATDATKATKATETTDFSYWYEIWWSYEVCCLKKIQTRS